MEAAIKPHASRVSYDMLASTLECINDAVVLATPGDEILYVNPAFCAMYGYTSEEVIGQHSSILWSNNNPPEITSHILPTTLIDGMWTGELLNTLKSGEEITIQLTTARVYDNAGKLIGLVGVAHNITDRKKAESQILEQHLVLADRNAALYEELSFARRLQQAILPGEQALEKVFPEAFTLTQARNVLTGDFFWHAQQLDRVFLALVQTGVGGPGGAFLSVLLHGMLNQIVMEEMVLAPNEVVARLLERLEELWRSPGHDDPLATLIQQQLGSDSNTPKHLKTAENQLRNIRGAFFSFPKNFRSVRYSAIGLTPQLIRAGKWQPLAAEPAELLAYDSYSTTPDKIPSHLQTLQMGDTLYMFTQGLTKQLNPKTSAVFNQDQLLAYLAQQQGQNMFDQKKRLEQTLRLARGAAGPSHDFVCIGLRF